jgi:predicted ribosome-associated RNA-binding protein Tma20
LRKTKSNNLKANIKVYYRVSIQSKTEVENEKIEVAAIIYFENKILCVQRPKINSYISLRSLNFQVEN